MAKLRDRWPELCNLVAIDDGLPVRETGPWAEDKLYFWNRYIDITTRALVGHPKWEGLVYVDLFAGPGVCVVKDGETRHRIPGSVLIAANAPKAFSKIIACELDRTLADALRTRLANSPAAANCHVVEGNCNSVIQDVVQLIPPQMLTLAFVDPTGLHARFSTIESLAGQRRTDLLILIADRMDIVRNVKLYHTQKMSHLDHFLGVGSRWRERFSAMSNHSAENICELFLNIYTEQLSNRLGYKVFGRETMKRSARAPLYKILFASKDELGLAFWEKVTRKERSGQNRMF